MGTPQARLKNAQANRSRSARAPPFSTSRPAYPRSGDRPAQPEYPASRGSHSTMPGHTVTSASAPSMTSRNG